MVKIAVYGKGGIGKSTMSSNITAALSDLGYRVMQIGCDPKHDSTRLLLNGEVRRTVLEYMKDTPVQERKLEDIVAVGYKGCLCTEAGGPEPGVGCAGRGIISAFDLLRELGSDTISKDVTIYDVLGDVVCGGFAVPLRNEYADLVYIVSSGEFMSIYAANNILKGIGNYDPDRVGGIIFNSRGDPEEKDRIKRFSEAVRVPIVASFERSSLFREAEENGRTVIEMFPDDPISDTFRDLAASMMDAKRYHANHLGEEELESCILGRCTEKRKERHDPAVVAATPISRRKYVSRNVLNNEPYGGCAFSGAHSTCASIKGLRTILHSPLSCAQIAFQCVSHTFGRYMNYHIPVNSYSDPSVVCTDMDHGDMVFGGTADLERTLRESFEAGWEDIAVITSCPSGIIGDDARGTVERFESTHPGCRIALIECDGNLNGDFIQGIIDSGIALCERFSKECDKTDTVNLIGTKPLALNGMNAVSTERELLSRIGVGVNCLFPGSDDLDSISRISSARLDIGTNPDIFTVQLGRYLEDRYGIPTVPVPVRPGLKGTLAWVGYVAEFFGKEKEFSQLSDDLQTQFDELAAGCRHSLEGRTYVIASSSKDIEWITEAADAAGMIRKRIAIVERSDYSNDMDLDLPYDDVKHIGLDEIIDERKVLDELSPDVVISTMPFGTTSLQISIPLVQVPGPFTGIEFMRRIAAMLSAPETEGWRKDVVHT